MSKIRVSLLLLVVLSSAAHAADVGVSGSYLSLDSRDGGRVQFAVLGDRGVTKGAAAERRDPPGLDGTLDIFYTDAPSSVAGAWVLPPPWHKNKAKAADFLNRRAPAGPTTVRFVRIHEGRSVELVAEGLGDGGKLLDLSAGAPSASGGITVVLTVRNAIDQSIHRMCTRFATASGSSVRFEQRGQRLILTARRGVPADCPSLVPAVPAGCELLNAVECLLPYPSSEFLVPASTPTGFRVKIPQEGLPHVNGSALPALVFDDLDGFSPGSQVLMHFPQGVDPERSNASRLLPAECCGQPPGPPWIDTRTYTGRSLDPDSPTVLLDADTGERILHFIEPDARATGPARQILFLRPARLLVPGHRYIVALRNLVAPSGAPVVAETPFALLRDGFPSGNPQLEARRARMESDVFAVLTANGIARDDLVLAFDFVVGSQASLTDQILSMRDQSYAWLDTVAADPAMKTFTVTRTTDNDCNQPGQVVWRRVTGTFQSPLFLTGDLNDTTTPVTNVDANGTPVQNGFTNAAFTVTIPCTALTGAVSRPLLLGHGLFQTGDLFTSLIPPVVGTVVRWDAVTGATDWRGLSGPDLGWVTSRIIGVGQSQLHHFPAFPARLRQGMLNTLVLVRMMKLGLFNRDAAFHTPAGADAFPGPSADAFYYGISLGGIMGTYLAGLTPDIERFGLDVPGVNFSCLLQRASPFRPFDALLAGIGITDPLSVALGVQLTHELWASAEPVAVAHHVTSDPLPGSGGAKRVLLMGAWLDKQVSNVCTEIEARTLGLPMLEGSIQQGLQEIPDVAGPVDSAAIFWDLGELDILNPAHQADIPPLANLFPTDTCDPHPRRPTIAAAIRQITDFLKPGGRITNTCDGLCDGQSADEKALGAVCVPGGDGSSVTAPAPEPAPDAPAPVPPPPTSHGHGRRPPPRHNHPR